jgi:aspartate kinase
MFLNKLGYKAISYMGWQIPIITDNIAGEARIKSIDDTKILENLDNKTIVVIAGFQGIDDNGNITTLGRGGSDTTAVALAAELKAAKCEIYSDVDGVFSADPQVVENSVKVETITYDEMLELASEGANVLHTRCVEIGSNFNIPIIVKSTFDKRSAGTIVQYQKDIESMYISGITKIDNMSRVTLIGLNDKIDKVNKLFNLLAENNINIDIIVQSYGDNILKDVSFSLKTADLKKTINLLKRNLKYLGAKEFLYLSDLAKVSVVGVGVSNTPGIATRIFNVLGENDIKIHMINTSEIKVSILVDQTNAETAMQAIHDEFIG